MKKIISTFLVSLILTLLVFQTNSYASSLSLSVSKGEVAVGETVTVTVNFGQKVAAADVTLSFDSSKFAYKSVSAGTGNSTGSSVKVSFYSATNDISSMTFTFTAISAGSASFSASCKNTANINVEKVDVTGTASKSINVVAKKEETPKESTPATTSTPAKTTTTTTTKKETTPKKEETKETKSNNTNLSSLEIKDFTLTPEFNKNTTKYYLSVNQDINQIEVLASPEDNKSKTEISGNTNLSFRINNITIKVTAEDRN